MIHLERKVDVERYVHKSKNFYVELILFVLVAALALVMYNLSSGDSAWLLYVVSTWGVFLFLKASKLHIISHNYYDMAAEFRNKLPFINKNWEAEKVAELMGKMSSSQAKKAPAQAIKAAPAAKAKKAAVKKAVIHAKPAAKPAPKTAAKKVVKKAAPKKATPKKVSAAKKPAKKKASPKKKG
ncbi:MAG: 2TM domain-containing protein [Alphaproteobacteria bacterium]